MNIPVKYIDTSTYTATLSLDPFADNPTNDGNFTIVTFGRNNLITDTDRDDYFDTNPVMRWLESGKAYLIDYYSHGQSSYKLHNTYYENADGLIVLDDDYIEGVSPADRQQYAKQDLETYTYWANGEVYYVALFEGTNTDGESFDSCGNLYGYEYAKQSIYDNLSYALPENINIVEEL